MRRIAVCLFVCLLLSACAAQGSVSGVLRAGIRAQDGSLAPADYTWGMEEAAVRRKMGKLAQETQDALASEPRKLQGAQCVTVCRFVSPEERTLAAVEWVFEAASDAERTAVYDEAASALRGLLGEPGSAGDGNLTWELSGADGRVSYARLREVPGAGTVSVELSMPVTLPGSLG